MKLSLKTLLASGILSDGFIPLCPLNSCNTYSFSCSYFIVYIFCHLILSYFDSIRFYFYIYKDSCNWRKRTGFACFVCGSHEEGRLRKGQHFLFSFSIQKFCLLYCNLLSYSFLYYVVLKMHVN